MLAVKKSLQAAGLLTVGAIFGAGVKSDTASTDVSRQAASPAGDPSRSVLDTSSLVGLAAAPHPGKKLSAPETINDRASPAELPRTTIRADNLDPLQVTEAERQKTVITAKGELTIGEFEAKFLAAKSELENALNNVRARPQDGFYQGKDLSGNVISKGNYLNGHEVGSWEYYDRSGRIIARGEYDSLGVKTGEWLEQGTGRSRITVSYQDGKKNGPYTETTAEFRVLISGAYKNGQRDGRWEEFYLSGAPKRVTEYQLGDITSKEILTYHENGNLAERSHLQDGDLHDLRETWYEDKTLHESGLFEKGLSQGIHTTYYENGQIQEEASFLDGELNGPSSRNFENGYVAENGYYEGGVRTGAWRSYSPVLKGTITYESFYTLGKENGPVRIFDAQTGKLTEAYQVEDGQLQGPWKSFDPITGVIESTGFYQKNLRHGKFTIFGPDGKTILAEEDWANGKLIRR